MIRTARKATNQYRHNGTNQNLSTAGPLMSMFVDLMREMLARVYSGGHMQTTNSLLAAYF